MSNPYTNAVLADSPVGYWRLNETSGTTAADASGSGHNGTHVGVTLGVASASSNLGPAARYNGSSAYTGVPNHPDLVGWGDFSIELWLRMIAWGDTVYIAAVYDTSGGNRSWAIHTGSNQRLQLNLSSNGSGFDNYGNLMPSGAIEVGMWNHVVVVRDGSRIRSYLNGAEVDDREDSTGLLHSASSNMTLGARLAGTATAFVNADLDEVAVYNHALSPERIAAHYNAAFEEPSDPPAPPENLTAEPVSPTRIDLDWDAPSEGPTPDSYTVRARLWDGSDWGAWQTLQTGITQASYSHTGLDPEQLWQYEVRAVADSLAGDWSEPAQATTLAALRVPMPLLQMRNVGM